MLLLLWSCATGLVLGRIYENILPNKIVRRFLVFGVFFIVSNFVRTHTTHNFDGPTSYQNSPVNTTRQNFGDGSAPNHPLTSTNALGGLGI